MTGATLIHEPKLTRLPFTEFPQASDNDPSTKPPLLRDRVVLHEGSATKQTRFTF
jgi:hypothetical protein